MGRDWMPGKRADILAMAKTWSAVLAQNYQKWDIAQPEVTILNTKIKNVEDAQAALNSGGRTPENTARLREMYASLVAYMRQIKERKFFQPPLNAPDFIALRLRPPDTIRTPHIEVTEVVEFELRLRNIREVLVNFWIKGADHRAKPLRYDGAVLIWEVLASPPADVSALTRHTMASKTPHSLEFTEEERGKTVYIAASWQNERGNIGQWSEIQSAVIP